MDSLHFSNITPTILQLYCEAALHNADELLVEALLLRDHGHMARAYFLAVACIEEAGKALFAFDAQNRNLSDPAVRQKLKKSMESHGEKITYAMCNWALSRPDQREALRSALVLIGHIKRGREPSMYSDLSASTGRVQTPREVVRDSAARNCVGLAQNCLAHVHRHVIEKRPATFTSAQERLFTMKPSKFNKILKTENFWEYYISRMEAGQQDMAEAVLGYEQDHITSGIPFFTAQ